MQELFAKRFSKDPNMVYRRIGEQCLLVPIRRQTADLTDIYELNPLGGHIWDLIDGQRTVREIRDQLLAEFEVSPQDVEKDLSEFLAQLVELGGIKEV